MDINQTIEGTTALILALKNEQFEVILYLLSLPTIDVYQEVSVAYLI